MKLPGRLALKPSDRAGAMLVLVAITIIIFVIGLVFSIDIAYMQLVRSQLRTAADAAAKAGAITLSMSQDDKVAVQKAIDVAAQNIVASEPLQLAAGDVQIGNSVQNANGSWDFTAGGTPYNAIRVDAKRTAGSAGGSVRLFLGGILGRETFEPSQSATASQVDQDVVLVLDRSGSMAFDLSGVAWQYPAPLKHPAAYCMPPHATLSRWAAAASAVEAFIAAIETTAPREYLSIVSFSSDYSSCSTTVKASKLDSSLSLDYALARGAIKQISSNPIPGGTNIGAGIDEATKELKAKARKYAQRTIIVMTDGHWTDGSNPVDAARRAAAEKIRVHSITFSSDADEALMKDVARAGGGKHFHAPDAASLKKVYQEIAFTLPIILTE
jgi:Flp pilus assembly protein TadG